MRREYERGGETLTNPSLGNRRLRRLLLTQDLALGLAALALLGFSESVVRAALLGGLGLRTAKETGLVSFLSRVEGELWDWVVVEKEVVVVDRKSVV